ncbi:hypothetical protein BLA29_004694, partial [Euroglyphus maynei]
MILSQQRQQKGYWKTTDDLLLLKECARQLCENGRIDYVRLNGDIFPLRNPHRLFHRFRLLSRYVPKNFHEKSLNDNQLLYYLQSVKTKRFAMKRIRRPKLPKDPLKLLNYLRKLSHIQQMIMEGKHIEYNLDEDEDFVSDSDDDDDDDDDIEEIPTPSSTINLPTALTVLTRPNENNDEQQWTIDSCIQLYKHLKPLAGFFQRRCIYDTTGDVCCANMIRTILRELLDIDIQKNLSQTTSSIINNTNDSDSDSSNEISQSSLDTVRFYLIATSVSINQQRQQQQSSNIRSLFLPNYSTTYAYVLMQFLYNSMFIHSVENQYDMNDHDENILKQQLEYRKLRSIFLSLFLWPALLSRLRPDNDENDQQLQEIFLSNYNQSMKNDTNNTGEDDTLAVVVPIRKMGRKRK